MILEADGRTAEPEAIRLIARLAAGGMRDAESMLDQLLSAGDGPIDEAARPRPARARRCRGRRRRSSTRWSAATWPRACAILDDLEERGRDSRAFLDQVVDALRAELLDESRRRCHARPTGRGAVGRRAPARGDRPDRNGVGGLRLQLELALFGSSQRRESASPARCRSRRPTPVVSRADPAAAPSRAAPSKPVKERGGRAGTIAGHGRHRRPAEPTPSRRSRAAPQRAGRRTRTRTRVRRPRPKPRPERGPAAPQRKPLRPAPSRSSSRPGRRSSRAQPAPADEAADRGLPAGRRRRQRRHPRLPRGAGVPQGRRRAQASRSSRQGIGERPRPGGRPSAASSTNVELAAAATRPRTRPLVAEARRIFADDLVDVGEVS